MSFMDWLNDNLLVAALIGVACGIIAKYVVRGLKK
jgi:hypothetical protein